MVGHCGYEFTLNDARDLLMLLVNPWGLWWVCCGGSWMRLKVCLRLPDTGLQPSAQHGMLMSLSLKFG